jgi:hypothetical protein
LTKCPKEKKKREEKVARRGRRTTGEGRAVLCHQIEREEGHKPHGSNFGVVLVSIFASGDSFFAKKAKKEKEKRNVS